MYCIQVNKEKAKVKEYLTFESLLLELPSEIVESKLVYISECLFLNRCAIVKFENITYEIYKKED